MNIKILLPILMLVSLHAIAQDKQVIKIGAKAGFNISSLTKNIDLFDHPDEAYSGFKKSSKGSISAGIIMDVKLPGRFILGAELLYNARGGSYQEENDRVIRIDQQGHKRKTYNYYNYNISYLELPLTLNYNFYPATSSKWLFGYAGSAPTVAVRNKAVLKYQKNRAGENMKRTLDDVSSFNNSIIAGVQFGEEKASNTSFFADLRGSYMPSPVFSKAVNEQGKNLNTGMYTFTLSIGFKI